MRAALNSSTVASASSVRKFASASVNPLSGAQYDCLKAVHVPACSSATPFERVNSLIFEFEDELDLPQSRTATELQYLQYCVPLLSASSQQLWSDALAVRQALSDGQDNAYVDVKVFVQLLANKGHMVWVRHGTYHCPASLGIKHVKHTFVLATLPPSQMNLPVYYIVDPNWKDHFMLSGAHAEDYRALLSRLPPVFVGSAEQLNNLVHMLCDEMDKVFAARGVSLPPWRSPAILSGHWLVNQAEDEPVTPSCSTLSGTAASLTADGTSAQLQVV